MTIAQLMLGVFGAFIAFVAAIYIMAAPWERPEKARKENRK